MSNLNIFFPHVVLPSQTSRIPDETKKILGPKINPPPPTTKFPSPNFRSLKLSVKDWMIQHAKKWKVTVCGSFIHRTICRIYLFSSDSLNCAVSIVRARYSTNSYLNQGITKRSYIFIFAKFSYRQRNPLMKNFKTKKKYLYHLGNFNSPLPLQLARP